MPATRAWGVFSYFPTSKPTELEMMESEEVYMLNPSRWDPHQPETDTGMAALVRIGSIEVKAIDLVMETVDEDSEKPHPCYEHVPCAADQVSSILASVSTILQEQILYERMAERANLGKCQATIGSTNVTDGELMASTTIWPTLPRAVLVLPVTPRSSPISTIVPLYCSDSEYLVDKDQREEIDPSTDDEHLLDKLYEGSLQGEIDLHDIMVSVAHAGRSKGIDAEHLSKA
jgi:hypothetical protein